MRTAVLIALAALSCKQQAAGGSPVKDDQAPTAVTVTNTGSASPDDGVGYGQAADVDRARDVIQRVRAMISAYPEVMRGTPCPAAGPAAQSLVDMGNATYAEGAKVFQGVPGLDLGTQTGGAAFLALLSQVRCNPAMSAGDDHPGLAVDKVCEVFAYAGATGNEWVFTNIARQGTKAPMVAMERMVVDEKGKVIEHGFAAPPLAGADCAAIPSPLRQTWLCKADPGRGECAGQSASAG